MIRVRLLALLALTLAAAAALTGCDRSPFDKTEHALDEGQKKQAAGDAQGAANIFERALDGTAKTANTHFRLALLYDEKMGDAIGSIYHLHRYLTLAPNGVHAKEAKANLARLEPILATSLAGGTLVSHAEALKLKTENADLKRQLAERPPPPLPTGVDAGKIAARDARRNPAPGTRTYDVRPGDTMASIARKFYKNKARAKDLQDANLNAVPDPKKLKVGQTLIIP